MSETFSLIGGGFQLLFQPGNLLILFAGCAIGLVAGSIPGLSASNTTAVMLPLTLSMSTEGALIFIGAIYMCCNYGGSIPAILLKTPGTTGALATSIDGFPMALKGEAARGLGIALGASGFGGIFGSILAVFLVRPISKFALAFKTPELFLLALLGISIIISVSDKKLSKGLLAGCMGLLMATMPADPSTAKVRFTFGFWELYDGFPMIAAMVGLFAFPSLIRLIGRDSIAGKRFSDETIGVKAIWRGVKDAFRYPVSMIRSMIIGLVVGIIPGAGVDVAALLSYSQAKNFSKHPEEFGHGAVEGIIAPEASNNAVASGALIPAITIGIPGSATTAVLLAALTLHGVNAGPRVLVNYPMQSYALFVSIILASVIMVVLGLFYTSVASRLTGVQLKYLLPAIFVVCMAGSFASRGYIFDVVLFLIFGVLGFVMNTGGYEVVPLILGFVMGGLAEQNFSIAMQLSNAKFGIFFSSALCWIIWVVIMSGFAIPPILKWFRKRRNAQMGG